MNTTVVVAADTRARAKALGGILNLSMGKVIDAALRDFLVKVLKEQPAVLRVDGPGEAAGRDPDAGRADGPGDPNAKQTTV